MQLSTHSSPRIWWSDQGKSDWASGGHWKLFETKLEDRYHWEHNVDTSNSIREIQEEKEKTLKRFTLLRDHLFP